MLFRSLDELKDYLCERGCEESIVFDDYVEAFIGISQDCRAVYDYGKMIESFCKHNEGSTVDDAIEWIDYNTIRSIPYAGEYAPIVVFGVEE